MIALLENAIKTLLTWYGCCAVARFLAACAQHEAQEWIARNPDRADRLAKHIDHVLQRWQS